MHDDDLLIQQAKALVLWTLIGPPDNLPVAHDLDCAELVVYCLPWFMCLAGSANQAAPSQEVALGQGPLGFCLFYGSLSACK